MITLLFDLLLLIYHSLSQSLPQSLPNCFTFAFLGHNIEDSRKFGWKFDEKVVHEWSVLRDNVQDHIGSLNWGYKVALRNKDINYINAYGEFVGPHKIKVFYMALLPWVSIYYLGYLVLLLMIKLW